MSYLKALIRSLIRVFGRADARLGAGAFIKVKGKWRDYEQKN